MTIVRLPSLLLAIALLVCPQASRADSPDKPTGAHLSRTTAIRIARQTARRAGIHLDEYEAPRAEFEYYNPKQRWWSVGFLSRVPIPGGHFSVRIDDRTRAAKLSLGL